MNRINDFPQSCEASIRKSPLTSIFIAFLSGALFRVLPVSAILGALIRLAVLLVRPTLLIFGVAKVLDLYREKAR